MTIWIAILVTSVGCYTAKVLGLSVPATVLDRPLVRRFAMLAPVALLAALTAVQTLGSGRHLVLDARAVGLAAAAIMLLFRAPFLVVVTVAVGVTAGLRLLGWR
ncbi:MAG TPA: AzlD domain-containing protein [Pseudonocardiaceae bacterium]|jgi:branched-subunit amino acid transport protein|nr:AzlD domain-containing protein [Pseudonocardiaceae bacterium]